MKNISANQKPEFKLNREILRVTRHDVPDLEAWNQSEECRRLDLLSQTKICIKKIVRFERTLSPPPFEQCLMAVGL